jgi:hypothetical protein
MHLGSNVDYAHTAILCRNEFMQSALIRFGKRSHGFKHYIVLENIKLASLFFK